MVGWVIGWVGGKMGGRMGISTNAISAIYRCYTDTN